MNHTADIQQLFQLILKQESESINGILLARSKALGNLLSVLSSSQLNGLADLGKDPQFNRIEEIKKEIFKRDVSRWKIDGVGQKISEDGAVFRAKAEEATNAAYEIAQAAFEPDELTALGTLDTHTNGFELTLFKSYLIAAVEFARIKSI